jgi:hypothetical protein
MTIKEEAMVYTVIRIVKIKSIEESMEVKVSN